ncbi:hypothetical protein ILUMI_25128 [Ignelater luminosus]|uniref:Uncharacterized protein n=1 Tax=Ignelater luminosus TaxID=2038154 RepID=A0A8K0FWC3_IGNLU|nr:hypothetical protein ILUMI_25128 [Ignelater luminosus]
MSCGLDKCRRLSIERGAVVDRGFQFTDGSYMKAINRKEQYASFGLQQARRLNHTEIRSGVKSAYLRRVTSILKSSLNGKNLSKEINAYAVPVLTYTFGLVKLTATDLSEVERATPRLMTKYRVHHP